MPVDPQQLCEIGQSHLVAMRYLDAEEALTAAEATALDRQDWDTLSRLYMPLQECRRQRRQRCGEGTIRLDLLAESEHRQPDPAEIVARYPHGQLLVAGWASIEPAIRLRELAAQRQLYLETFLAAVYPMNGGATCVAIVPTTEVALPPASVGASVDHLIARLPPFSIVLAPSELPTGAKTGDTHTFAFTMALWERLHLPFLTAADQTRDLTQRVHAYRRTIEVDYACELAHQRLSDTARALVRAHRLTGP
jgi:hypothetical protein